MNGAAAIAFSYQMASSRGCWHSSRRLARRDDAGKNVWEVKVANEPLDFEVF
jgi:hypothetical protein